MPENIIIPTDRIPSVEDFSCYKCPMCKKIIVCGISEEEAKKRICPVCGCIGLSRTENIKNSISNDVALSRIEGKIPDEIYDNYAKDNQPLPESFYKDFQQGDAFAQFHYQSLDQNDMDEYKKGNITLADLIVNKNIHIDLRMDLQQPKLIQWVLIGDDIRTCLNGLQGEKSNMIAMAKPKMEELKNVLSLKDSRIASKFNIKKYSYDIPKGQIGASEDKPAYMSLIWKGTVKAGVQRNSFHEYFIFPDNDIPQMNQDLLNGKYVVELTKVGEDKQWIFAKCLKDKKPNDPFVYKDEGQYFSILD